MPTNIQFVRPGSMAFRFGPLGSGSSDARINLIALMIWSIVMLSISAFAQFGTQSSALGDFQLIGLF